MGLRAQSNMKASLIVKKKVKECIQGANPETEYLSRILKTFKPLTSQVRM
jgi:hypothetical protein